MYKTTLFLDIDGTLLSHVGNCSNILLLEETLGEQQILPGVLEKLNEAAYADYSIILTTGRPESMREFTQKQLSKRGIFFDQLIMGLPIGPRIIINDEKHNLKETAIGITIPRNEGLINVKF